MNCKGDLVVVHVSDLDFGKILDGLREFLIVGFGIFIEQSLFGLRYYTVDKRCVFPLLFWFICLSQGLRARSSHLILIGLIIVTSI